MHLRRFARPAGPSGQACAQRVHKYQVCHGRRGARDLGPLAPGQTSARCRSGRDGGLTVARAAIPAGSVRNDGSGMALPTMPSQGLYDVGNHPIFAQRHVRRVDFHLLPPSVRG